MSMQQKHSKSIFQFLDQLIAMRLETLTTRHSMGGSLITKEHAPM